MLLKKKKRRKKEEEDESEEDVLIKNTKRGEIWTTQGNVETWLAYETILRPLQVSERTFTDKAAANVRYPFRETVLNKYIA